MGNRAVVLKTPVMRARPRWLRLLCLTTMATFATIATMATMATFAVLTTMAKMATFATMATFAVGYGGYFGWDDIALYVSVKQKGILLRDFWRTLCNPSILTQWTNKKRWKIYWHDEYSVNNKMYHKQRAELTKLINGNIFSNKKLAIITTIFAIFCSAANSSKIWDQYQKTIQDSVSIIELGQKIIKIFLWNNKWGIKEALINYVDNFG